MINIKIKKLDVPCKTWLFTHNYEILIKDGQLKRFYGQMNSLDSCLNEVRKYHGQLKIELWN